MIWLYLRTHPILCAVYGVKPVENLCCLDEAQADELIHEGLARYPTALEKIREGLAETQPKERTTTDGNL